MRIIPTNDNVLVRLDPLEGVSGGNIIIPDIAKGKPFWGEVMAVGPGRYTKKGAWIPVVVKPGNRVCFPWATGQEILIDGNLWISIKEYELIAIEETN